MAKQDVLDAINATIVENGQKGITAQTLNNVLTMMTENAGGGGSGDGALRIMVPDTMSGVHEEFILAGEFSPAIWEQVKAEIAGSGIPLDVSSYDAAFSACFAHNAEVYQSILTKVKSHEGTFAILDQSLSMAVSYKMMMIKPEVPGAIEKIDVSSGQLALCVGIHLVPAEGYEEMLGQESEPMIMIAPLHGQPDMGTYPPELIMILMPDGSIILDASAMSGYQFYIPKSSNVSLTSEQKSANQSFKSYGQQSDFSWDNVEVFFVSSSGNANEYSRVSFVSYNRNSDSPYYCYFQGNALMKATLASDGSVSVETLGVLTAPTE